MAIPFLPWKYMINQSKLICVYIPGDRNIEFVDTYCYRYILNKCQKHYLRKKQHRIILVYIYSFLCNTPLIADNLFSCRTTCTLIRIPALLLANRLIFPLILFFAFLWKQKGSKILSLAALRLFLFHYYLPHSYNHWTMWFLSMPLNLDFWVISKPYL